MGHFPRGRGLDVAGLAEESRDRGRRCVFLVFVVGFVPYWLAGLATTRRFQFPDKENANLTPASFELAVRGGGVPRPGRDRAQGLVGAGPSAPRDRRDGARPQPLADRDGEARALRPLERLERAAPGPAPSRRERRERRRPSASRRRKTSKPPRASRGSASPGPVVLWGVSLGGASVVLAAADDPEVKGVICDSSFRSLDDTVRHHLRLFRGFRWWLRIVPSWPVTDLAIYWMGRRGRLRPGAVERGGRGSAPARPAGAVRGELRGSAHAEGDRLRSQGRRGAAGRRC